MPSIYEVLYDYACRRTELVRWLRNPLEVQYYYNCQEDADEFEQQLKEVLDQNGQRLLLGYIDSANLQRFFERQMLFCQGLSMGLELGLWAQL